MQITIRNTDAIMTANYYIKLEMILNNFEICQIYYPTLQKKQDDMINNYDGATEKNYARILLHSITNLHVMSLNDFY